MPLTTVTCPKCNHQFSIDEALSHQLEEQIKQQLSKQSEEEITELKKKLNLQAEEWKKEQQEKLQKQVAEEAKKAASQSEQELKLLKEENERKAKQLADAREMELKLRQERNQLEDEKKNIKLELQRQLDEERKKIEESMAQRMLDEHKLKDAEKEKQINDLKTRIEELQMKANLTSQQLQGEVQELELEQTLKVEFPLDDVVPVPKGINGADVIQTVYDQTGRVCGSIIWESKRTKNWDKEWIQKLKDDTRNAKADVAILVTAAMPDDIKTFGNKEGILVTNTDSFLGVAKLVRQKIIELCLAKLSSVGQSEKMEILYNYLRGNEFKQRVDAIVEAFSAMKSDLDKEKLIFTKMWAKREKQIQRAVDNMFGMHGDLHGLMGAALPEIESIEVTTVELIEEVIRE